MRSGKLNEAELNIALSPLRKSGGGIVQGAIIGQDCAVINCPSSGNMLITTDPVTYKVVDPYDLAITVNSNDIYASGGMPRYAMLTVLAPIDYNAEQLTSDIARVGRDARDKGIDIIGGHTEFTDAVNRLVLSVTMIGFVGNNNIISGVIAPNQDIIVTKYLALEGTRILIENSYIDGHDEAEIEELYSLPLSVRNESIILQDCGATVAAMHDITEGGLYGAVCELMSSSPYGAVLDERLLPILPITSKLADKLSFDVGRMISSGSMLIIADNGQSIIDIYKKNGIAATVVGQVCVNKQVQLLKGDGHSEALQVESDHIYRFN